MNGIKLNPVEIKWILNSIRDKTFKLRGKESGLLKSMDECVIQGKYATVAQSDWLQNIYRESQTGRGYQQRERS